MAPADRDGRRRRRWTRRLWWRLRYGWYRRRRSGWRAWLGGLRLVAIGAGLVVVGCELAVGQFAGAMTVAVLCLVLAAKPWLAAVLARAAPAGGDPSTVAIGADAQVTAALAALAAARGDASRPDRPPFR